MDDISNEQFFEELCDKYYEKVYFYCLRMAGHHENFRYFAEECAQETFLEAGKQIHKLRKHPNVQGWLYVTAGNILNYSLRKMYKKKKHEINTEDMDLNIADESCFSFDELLDYHVDLDELCLKVLGSLDAGEYDLYADYYRNKVPAAKLAEKYNISVTALTTRVYRLKKKIKMIAKEFIDNSKNNSKNF